ncbi:hypothetical protein F4825DRAFT_322217 [Nemania diffusa]|nr:hypothetical protein F4825DRAFT_322217 [Nemania diffusa]
MTPNFLISTTCKSLLPHSQRNESKVVQFLSHFLHLQSLIPMLDSLCKIAPTTMEYIMFPSAESSWNEQIHGRMLKPAVLHAPGVSGENITRAEIAKEFLPLKSDRPKFPYPSIDYAMVLQPLDTLHVGGGNENGSNKGLPLSRIINFGNALAYLSFNQSSYDPLCYMSSDVFIKTRISIHESSEAKAQLGI